MAAWKRRSDMRMVCGHIFEDRNIQLYLNAVSYTHLSHLLLAHGRMEEMI